MRQKHHLCLGALVLILLAGSVTFAQDVRSNYMPGTDFSKYHSYRWITVEGAQIKQAIDAQLAAKGLKKMDGDQADLAVDYQVAVNQERQWNAYNMGGVGWRWGGGMATATSSTIQIGTLVLDMYDQAEKQLVWSGTATKTLNPSKNQEKNQKNLDKAMQKLLKDFPPKQK
jgi:hypothetical protein